MRPLVKQQRQQNRVELQGARSMRLHMGQQRKRSNLTDARSTSPPHEAAELIKLNIPLHETPHEATAQPVWE